MAEKLYCWRCQTEMPMLDEDEWAEVETLLRSALRDVKSHRAMHAQPLSDQEDVCYGEEALERYFQITGFRETNVHALWHHRRSLFGQPCDDCGKPLRTPRAKLCAECGATKSARS